MAEWKYLEEYRAVVQLPSSVAFGKTIANDVDPEDGLHIALVPRMFEVIPELIGLLDSWGIRAGAITKARDILREIDAAKEAL